MRYNLPVDKKVLIVGILIVLTGTALGVWQNSQAILFRNSPKLQEPPIEEQIAQQAKCIAEGVPPPLPIPIYIQGKPLPSLDFEEVRKFLKGLGYKELEYHYDWISGYRYSHPNYREIITLSDPFDYLDELSYARKRSELEHLATMSIQSASEVDKRLLFPEDKLLFEKLASSAGKEIGVEVGVVNIKDRLTEVRAMLRSTPHMYASAAEMSSAAGKAAGELLGKYDSSSTKADQSKARSYAELAWKGVDTIEMRRGIYEYSLVFTYGRLGYINVDNRPDIGSFTILKDQTRIAKLLRKWFNSVPREKYKAPELPPTE
jgi:hypothetical protein